MTLPPATYLILLTNSVHPHDKGTSRPIRQKIAEIVFPAPAGPGAPDSASSRKRTPHRFEP